MATIKSYTDIEQSRKLAKILSVDSADMLWGYYYNGKNHCIPNIKPFRDGRNEIPKGYTPAWSLAALLKLIPKHILRKDKIYYGQEFIPTFKWEITPTAIYYTDGNDIMDYVSFRYGYGANNIELIDAVFKMVVWLKEKGLL